MATGATIITGVAFWTTAPLPAVIGAMMILAIGSGLSGPVALAKALENAGSVTGSATALFGASQMLIAAGVSAVIAHIATTQTAMLLAIAVIAACAVLAFTAAGREHS